MPVSAFWCSAPARSRTWALASSIAASVTPPAPANAAASWVRSRSKAALASPTLVSASARMPCWAVRTRSVAAVADSATWARASAVRFCRSALALA